eukprot:9399875-Alexandrium_andersonii.AAC.1
MATAMQEAANQHIVTTEPRPKTPWIREETLDKIKQRGDYARAGEYSKASDTDKSIRKMSRKDRVAWFSEKLTVNVWDP